MSIYVYVKNERQKGKNTDCPADIKVRIDNPGESNYSKHSKKQQEELKSKREAVKQSPFWFRISFDHNHCINIAEHQKFRTVSKETKDAFTELFEDDLTASAAWDKHRKKIKDDNPDSWPILLGDRSICPDYFWSFYCQSPDFP